MFRKAKQRQKLGKAGHPHDLSMSGDVELGLAGFKSTYIPDVMPLKLVYSDYRVLVASSNQAEYVYRANSVFDPDFTGVGGQPDGFDMWNDLYQNYRVVAVGIDVQAQSNGSASYSGLLAVAVTPDSAAFNSAEELAGLRKSGASVFNNSTVAKVKLLFHISELYGMSDATVLSESNFGALVGANPGNQQYIHIGVESNAAAGETMVWVKITYYTRLEVPTNTLDALAKKHERMFLRRASPELSLGAASSTSGGNATLTQQPVKSSALAAAVAGDEPVFLAKADCGKCCSCTRVGLPTSSQSVSMGC